mgnify:CR=1 FL=1
MINNRQAGRRNRGRNNNGRPNGNNRGGGDNGNRIDNRARGNAAQLLEKYKNMARDAQMAGDRVNAEYYLQFADHYFRVLADNRARQEEQQQRFRPRDDNFDEDGDDFDGMDQGADDFRVDQPVSDRPTYDRQNGDRHGGERAPRDQDRRSEEGREGRDGDGRNNRRDRNRRDRFQGNEGAPVQAEAQPIAQADAAPEADTQPVAAAPAAAGEAKPRRGRPRKVKTEEAAGEGFDVAVLPPSIARADNDAEADGEAPKKRTRRPRSAATEAAE